MPGWGGGWLSRWCRASLLPKLLLLGTELMDNSIRLYLKLLIPSLALMEPSLHLPELLLQHC